MANTHDVIRSRMQEVYDEKIERYGCTAPAVGWNSVESQEMRFAQLLKVVDRSVSFSINDYGCGYGALADYLRKGGYSFRYCGFDVSSQMIKNAKERHANHCEVSFVGSESSLAVADYTIGSGIFNLKSDTPTPEWESYILETI